jgi:hypothetical protein
MKKALAIAGALFLLSTLGFALFGESANYRSSPDAMTGGGSGATGGSYRAGQQAMGQTAGVGNGASYGNRAGVVQPPPTTPSNDVPDWRQY